jgi:hypothetical protein
MFSHITHQLSHFNIKYISNLISLQVTMTVFSVVLTIALMVGTAAEEHVHDANQQLLFQVEQVCEYQYCASTNKQ